MSSKRGIIKFTSRRRKIAFHSQYPHIPIILPRGQEYTSDQKHPSRKTQNDSLKTIAREPARVPRRFRKGTGPVTKRTLPSPATIPSPEPKDNEFLSPLTKLDKYGKLLKAQLPFLEETTTSDESSPIRRESRAPSETSRDEAIIEDFLDESEFHVCQKLLSSDMIFEVTVTTAMASTSLYSFVPDVVSDFLDEQRAYNLANAVDWDSQLELGYYTPLKAPASGVGYFPCTLDQHSERWCLIRDYLYDLQHEDQVKRYTAFQDPTAPSPTTAKESPSYSDIPLQQRLTLASDAYKFISPLLRTTPPCVDDLRRILIVLQEDSVLDTYTSTIMPFHVQIHPNWASLADNSLLENTKKFCVVYLLLEETLDGIHIPDINAEGGSQAGGKGKIKEWCGSMLDAWREAYKRNWELVKARKWKGFQYYKYEGTRKQESREIVDTFRKCTRVGEVLELFNPVIPGEEGEYGNEHFYDEDFDTNLPSTSSDKRSQPPPPRLFETSQLYKVHLAGNLPPFTHSPTESPITITFRQATLYPFSTPLPNLPPKFTSSLGDTTERALRWIDFCLRFVKACEAMDWEDIQMLAIMREISRSGLFVEGSLNDELWFVVSAMMGAGKTWVEEMDLAEKNGGQGQSEDMPVEPIESLETIDTGGYDSYTEFKNLKKPSQNYDSINQGMGDAVGCAWYWYSNAKYWEESGVREASEKLKEHLKKLYEGQDENQEKDTADRTDGEKLAERSGKRMYTLVEENIELAVVEGVKATLVDRYKTILKTLDRTVGRSRNGNGEDGGNGDGNGDGNGEEGKGKGKADKDENEIGESGAKQDGGVEAG